MNDIERAYTNGYTDATNDANESMGVLVSALAHMMGGDVTITLDDIRKLGTKPSVDIIMNNKDGSTRIIVKPR